MTSENKDFKAMLDAVDQVKEKVRIFPSTDETFREKLKQTLPTLCMVGAQSSGKSSILSRISGIRLPTGDGTCTRIAILLKLRRDSKVTTKVIKYALTYDDGAVHDEETTPEESSAEVIKRLQLRAMETSKEQAFISNACIEVSVTSNDVPNVTLVDLPGLTTDEGAEATKAIVKKHLDRDGTIALFFAPVHQDFQTVLGSSELEKYRQGNKIVLVFTQPDKLEALKDNQDTDAAIRGTLEKTNGEDRFLVFGKDLNLSKEEEKRQIQNMSVIRAYSSEFKGLGCRALGDHIEELMKSRMGETLPDTLRIFKDELSKVRRQVQTLNVKEPVGILLDAVQKAEKVLELTRGKKEVRIRKRFESFRREFGKLGISVINTENEEAPREFNQFVDDVGLTHVQTQPLASEDDCKSGIVTSVKTSKRVGKGFDDIETLYECEDENGSRFQAKTLYTAEPSVSVVVWNIQEVCDMRRGCVMPAHLGALDHLSPFAEEYANNYHVILEKLVCDVYLIMREIFDEVLHSMQGIEVSRVRDRLRKDWDHRLNTLKEQCMAGMRDLRDGSISPHPYSLNDHYANSMYQNMISQDSNMASDEGGFREAYYKIQAYLKVVRKVVVDAASWQIRLRLDRDAHEAFRALLNEGIQKYKGDVDVKDRMKKLKQEEIKRDVLEDIIKILEVHC